MRAVEACIAGQWKACMADRKNMMMKMCQSAMDCTMNRTIRSRVPRAVSRSARSMTFFLSSRSTYAPANGDRNTCGRSPIAPAMARSSGDAVVTAIQNIRAHWTRALPRREKACPAHSVKNRRIHGALVPSCSGTSVELIGTDHPVQWSMGPGSGDGHNRLAYWLYRSE